MKKSITSKVMLLALCGATVILAACDRGKAPDLMHAPPTYSAAVANGNRLTVSFNPMVDILFVFDNSKSMAEEQAKLRQASASFIEKLGGSSVLDYRVGVITVYDETHCSKLNNCQPAGKLLSPFVSRNPNAKAQLDAALNVGLLEPKDGGPEFEQLFYPIANALTSAMNQINGNFIRANSRVVVIMVTDESDTSLDLSIDDFLESAKNSLGSLSRLDMYAIINNSSRNDYARDRQPTRIKNLIAAAEGRSNVSDKLFEINSGDFGAHLGDIVTDIKTRTLGQEFQLPSRPESKTIQLFYGDDEVKEGWAYNPITNSIVINEDIAVNYDFNKVFTAKYVKIEPHSVQNGKIEKVVH